MASLYQNWKLRCKNLSILKIAKNFALVSISIIHKQSKDTHNKNKNLKTKILHLVLKIILDWIYPSLIFKKWDANNVIALLQYLKDDIELVYIESYISRFYNRLQEISFCYKH